MLLWRRCCVSLRGAGGRAVRVTLRSIHKSFWTNLAAGMPGRCRRLIAAKGYRIKN